ncbi:carbonic anhydrase 4-like [Amblyraja radiata]|uniref:carbonic anhydrase 4-like n=1 Tax=Amblyraja radiata TaxID=386614 RepID=UPI00140306AC|nr:carbonic anhydrase 4-like [Amblyraja radiata]
MRSLNLFLVSLLMLPYASGAGDWCYDFISPNCGPGTWSGKHPQCAGRSQSPIDIITKKATPDPKLTDITFKGYLDPDTSLNWALFNDGHSVQLILNGSITISGGMLPGTYKADHLHFHWGTATSPGSEHTIDGTQYPMEMHIVHLNQNYRSKEEALKHPDGLAVVAFMFTESDSDAKDFNFIQYLKHVKNYHDKYTIKPFSLENMIPNDLSKNRVYYRYQGSLTTPTCNQAVIWTVYKEPIPLSKDQLNEFPKTLHYNDTSRIVSNFRPIQNLNGRTVYVFNSGSLLFRFNLLMCVIGIRALLLFN